MFCHLHHAYVGYVTALPCTATDEKLWGVVVVGDSYSHNTTPPLCVPHM